MFVCMFVCLSVAMDGQTSEPIGLTFDMGSCFVHYFETAFRGCRRPHVKKGQSYKSFGMGDSCWEDDVFGPHER